MLSDHPPPKHHPIVPTRVACASPSKKANAWRRFSSAAGTFCMAACIRLCAALQNVIKSDHAQFLLHKGRFHSSVCWSQSLPLRRRQFRWSSPYKKRTFN